MAGPIGSVGRQVYGTKGEPTSRSPFAGLPMLNPTLLGRLGGADAEVTGFGLGALAPGIELAGRHVVLRSFHRDDFAEVVRVTRASAEHLAPAGFIVPALDQEPDPLAFEDWVDRVEVEQALDRRYEFGGFDGEAMVGGGTIWGVVRGSADSAYAAGWIASPRRGEQLGPEVLLLLCQFAFDQLGLHRLEAPVLPENQPSRSVMDTLGFRDEGLAHDLLRVNDRWRDHVRYVMSAEDWQARGDALIVDWLT
jgi:[ribosomal protein S5]-alanine N-acetyltransferase